MLTINDRFTVPSSVAARELSGEMVILDTQNGVYFGLNSIGTRIWGLIEKGETLSQICQDLAKEYDIPNSVLTRDVLSLAEELKSRGLIESP